MYNRCYSESGLRLIATKKMSNGYANMDTRTLARIEAKLDLVLMSVLGRATPEEEGGAGGSEEHGELLRARTFFRQFTPKQNAALQMLMRGASNQEIADRMGVSVNTAKVHVRSIAAKLDVKSRASIAVTANRYWRDIGGEEYLMASGGLPKDWDDNWSEGDPLKPLYFSGVTASEARCRDSERSDSERSEVSRSERSRSGVTLSAAKGHGKEEGDDVEAGEERGRVPRPGHARKGGRVKRKGEGIDGQE